MKIKRRPFMQLLLMVGFVFTVITACNKTDDPSDSQNTATLKDACDNVYKTIKIGSQVWMAENLKTTKYNDGTEILRVGDYLRWSDLTTGTGAYCNYNNLESNAEIYGRLYNWDAVNTGKLAPAGWHVPSDHEWNILRGYLIANGNYDGTQTLNDIAKSLCAKTNWALSSEADTPGAAPQNNNSTGFTALPGGCRFNFDARFDYIGKHGYWWSSTRSSEGYAYSWSLTYDDKKLDMSNYSKSYGFSVRLVRD